MAIFSAGLLPIVFYLYGNVARIFVDLQNSKIITTNASLALDTFKSNFNLKSNWIFCLKSYFKGLKLNETTKWFVILFKIIKIILSIKFW
jgi:hypothetical protein